MVGAQTVAFLFLAVSPNAASGNADRVALVQDDAEEAAELEAEVEEEAEARERDTKPEVVEDEADEPRRERRRSRRDRAEEREDDYYDEEEDRPRRRKRRRGGPSSRDGDYDLGFERGEQLADGVSSSVAWFCAGALCSPMCWGLGCLAVNGYACLGGVDVPPPDSSMSSEEARGFRDGYEEEVSSTRLWAALAGTFSFAIVAGVVAAIGIVVVGGIAAVGALAGGI